MCSFCNEQKVLTTMMGHAGNRSPQVKSKVAKCLQQIISKLGNKITTFKENYKIIDQLATFLSDASQEVRNNARLAFNTLSQLCSKLEFEEMVSKSLNEQKYNKVKEVMEQGLHSSMNEFSPAKQSQNRGGSTRGSRRHFVSGDNSSKSYYNEGGKYSSSNIKRGPTNSKNINIEEEDAIKSRNLINAQRSSNKSRSSNNVYGSYDKNMDANNAISINHNDSNIYKAPADSKTIRSSSSKYSKRKISKRSIKKLEDVNVPKAPDFSKRSVLDTPSIEESNIFIRLGNADSKISSKAAELLINNFDEYEKDVPNNLGAIINSQAALFCSNNENIKLRAEELIDKCVEKINASIIIKPICNTIASSNNRSKVMLLEKLNKILPQVAEENPVLLSKHALPVVYALLDDKSKYIKKKVEDLVLTLYGLIGSALIEFSPSNKLQLILDII